MTNSNKKEIKLKDDLIKDKQKRKGIFIWDGFHSSATPSNKWKATFNLKEVARSKSDSDLLQFEVESVVSEKHNDFWGTSEYADFFYKRYNFRRRKYL